MTQAIAPHGIPVAITEAKASARFEALCEANELALIDATVAAFGRHASRVYAKAAKTAGTNLGAASIMMRTAVFLEDCARDVAALRDPALGR